MFSLWPNNCLKDKTSVKLLGRIRNVLLPILNILIICFNKCRETIWVHSCMLHDPQPLVCLYLVMFLHVTFTTYLMMFVAFL